MSTNKLSKAASIIAKILLWLGAGIFIFFAIGSIFIFGRILFELGVGRSPLEAPLVHINTQPSLKYLITLRPIVPNEFTPTSARVEITRVIERDTPSRSSCLPSRYETGTEYPDYPVKESPKAQVSPDGVVTFIANYDYIKKEDYYGKGVCNYRIYFVHLTLQNNQATVTPRLSWEEFDEFERGVKTIVIFCDLTDKNSKGYCRTNLNSMSGDFALKYRPTFIPTRLSYANRALSHFRCFA